MISLSRYWRIAKLIERCSRRPADKRAWQEFVRRFHLTIQGSVAEAFDSRAGGGLGSGLQLGEKLKDDLVQSVYRKLVEDRSRLLKGFRGKRSSAFRSFLGIVSAGVVSSYLGGSQANAAMRSLGFAAEAEAVAAQPDASRNPRSLRLYPSSAGGV